RLRVHRGKAYDLCGVLRCTEFWRQSSPQAVLPGEELPWEFSEIGLIHGAPVRLLLPRASPAGSLGIRAEPEIGCKSIGSGGILAPLRTADPIQGMQAQRVTFGNARVLEVLIRVAHADALHDRTRPLIADSRERHDVWKAKPPECDAQDAARCLRGEALAPEGASQPPTDLDA